MSLCSHEWVLNLDADEELLPPLVNRFAEVIQQDKYASVRNLRDDIFIDKAFSPLTKKPHSCRLFKKSRANFDTSKLAHESADVEGDQLSVCEVFNHYGYNEISPVVDKINLYASLKASEKFDKGRSFSKLKLFLVLPVILSKAYVLQRLVFSGTRGLISAVNTGYYAFLKEAKLYEQWHRERQAPESDRASVSRTPAS